MLFAVEEIDEDVPSTVKGTPKRTWFLRRDDGKAVKLEDFTLSAVREGLDKLGSPFD